MYQQMQQNQQNRTYRSRKKLRESCNNCALSKVKCGKEQPVCARCDEREMYCHYSPTRRTGKRRAWSHTSADGGSELPPSLKSITPPEEQSYFDYHGLVFNQEMLSREDLLENRNLDNNASSQSLSSLMSPPLSLQLQTGKAIGDAQSQIHDTMFSKGNIWGDSNMYMGPLAESYLQKPLPFMDQDPNFNMLMPLSSDEDQDSGKKGECQLDQNQHCMNRALDILQKLHTPLPNCSLALESKVESKASGRSIDELIATNKEVLDVVHQILDCPCSLDIQLAFILTTITSKIISWYSAVAQNNEDQSAGSTPRRLTTSPATSENLPFAGYSDGNSKSKMHAQLVLSELHLVLRLIDKLVARFKGLELGEKGSGSGAMEMLPVFVELEAFLRHRLRILVKETTEVLRAN
jgi:hypothetical protein